MGTLNGKKFKQMDERLNHFVEIAEDTKSLDISSLKNIYFSEKKNFSLNDISKIWVEGLKKNNDLILNLYINIPFCLSRCKYCRHPAYKFNNILVKIYLNYLIQLSNYYKKIFKNYSFETLYIGGGTPSILTLDQIRLLFSSILNNFNIKKEAIITFECNPNTITYEKLKLLRSLRVNRISIGVQSTDRKVLKNANRQQQNIRQVNSAILNAKRIGFESVNVDLILGLKGDNSKSVFASCKHILSMKPDHICIYKYKPDSIHFSSYINLSPEDHYKKIQSLSLELIKDLKSLAIIKRNYKIINNDNCISLELIANKKLDYEKLRTDFSKSSVLGLGQFALSWLFNTFHYEEQDNNFIFNEEKKYCSGVLLPDKYEISRYIHYSFKNINSRIDKKEFEGIFNKKIEEVFGDELQYLLKIGKIKSDKEYIYFLPKDNKERLVYSMFF